MDPRYPVGKFSPESQVTSERRAEMIRQIGEFPGVFRATVNKLPHGALDKPYRDGGWTGRQVVHHVADSHMNAYVRVRLALTEQDPRIKTYEESLWAELTDAKTADPALSLALLDALHRRWHILLESLRPSDFARNATHPDFGLVNVDWLLQMYSWHGRHHTGHLNLLMS